MTHARRTLLTVGALALTVASGVGQASATPTLPAVPNGATRAAVHTDKVHAHVDFAVTDAAAITGVIRDASSESATPGVVVTARDRAGHVVGSRSTTRFDGRYTILGLPRSTTGFAVCITPTKPKSGPRYGYAGRCYGSSARYLGAAPPSSSTFVKTVPGTTRTGIDLESGGNGAIGGRVSGAGVAHAGDLRDVTVRVYDLADRLVASTTGRGGAYSFTSNLPSGSYHVCVDARRVFGAALASGFVGHCFGSRTSWIPGRAVPSDARTVVVNRDAATRHIDLRLLRGGAIAGTVRTLRGRAITGSKVVAYRNGLVWASVRSSSVGGFRLRGLPSGRFRICASGGDAPSFTEFFDLRCVRNVGVRRLGTHPDVAMRLARGNVPIGSIGGVVRDSSGRALADVRVDAFAAAGRLVATTTSGVRGHYVLAGIRASAHGYRVCFSGDVAGPPSTTVRPATGYEAVCYSQIRWNRGSLPTMRASLVTVAAGRTHRGVNATLGDGGTITGRVTYNGAALFGAAVYVADANHHLVRLTTTDTNGRYSVAGLTPTTLGYVVCTLGGTTRTAGTAGDLGYRGRCTGGLPWDPIVP